MVDYGNWSIKAKHAHKAALAARRAYQDAKRYFAKGPVLRPWGERQEPTILVPAMPGHYDREAAVFWRSVGFQWDPDYYCWLRPVYKPYRGKVWTEQQWLKSAARKWNEFYGHLLPDKS